MYKSPCSHGFLFPVESPSWVEDNHEADSPRGPRGSVLNCTKYFHPINLHRQKKKNCSPVICVDHEYEWPQIHQLGVVVFIRIGI